MTKLIVTPIDMSARGSFRERQRVWKLYLTGQRAQKAGDLEALAAAFEDIEVLITKHATTDDGSTVAEALELASAEEFDLLLNALFGSGETVPNPKSAS